METQVEAEPAPAEDAPAPAPAAVEDLPDNLAALVDALGEWGLFWMDWLPGARPAKRGLLLLAAKMLAPLRSRTVQAALAGLALACGAGIVLFWGATLTVYAIETADGSPPDPAWRKKLGASVLWQHYVASQRLRLLRRRPHVLLRVAPTGPAGSDGAYRVLLRDIASQRDLYSGGSSPGESSQDALARLVRHAGLALIRANRLDTAEVVARLRRGVSGGDSRARLDALLSLGLLGREALDALPAVSDTARQADEPELRIAAWRIVARILGDPADVEGRVLALDSGTYDPDESVRAAVTDLLADARRKASLAQEQTHEPLARRHVPSQPTTPTTGRPGVWDRRRVVPGASDRATELRRRAKTLGRGGRVGVGLGMPTGRPKSFLPAAGPGLSRPGSVTPSVASGMVQAPTSGTVPVQGSADADNPLTPQDDADDGEDPRLRQAYAELVNKVAAGDHRGNVAVATWCAENGLTVKASIQLKLAAMSQAPSILEQVVSSALRIHDGPMAVRVASKAWDQGSRDPLVGRTRGACRRIERLARDLRDSPAYRLIAVCRRDLGVLRNQIANPYYMDLVSERYPCKKCHGDGRIGMWRSRKRCTACKGKGSTIKKGYVRKKRDTEALQAKAEELEAQFAECEKKLSAHQEPIRNGIRAVCEALLAGEALPAADEAGAE